MGTMQLARKEYVSRALETAIHVGLLSVLVAVCFLILRPFLPLIAWGIIVAVAVYPAYARLKTAFRGRGTLAAVLTTIVLLAALIVPAILLTGTLVEGVQTVTTRIREGSLTIPAPPASIKSWPIIGAPLTNMWSLASSNVAATLSHFAPQIKTIIPGLLSATAGIGLTLLQLMLSIVLAGVLLANAEDCAKISRAFADRLFGSRGAEFDQLMGSTIRSVTIGVLGVAIIQSVLAGIGFLAVGLPGAGLWAIVFLIAAVLQVGGPLLIPAVIYAFAITSTTKAMLFLVWCAFVGLMDNVLKPILLGRGAAVPIAVVFVGVIGGFVSMGFIGMFVGAIVLSVGYKLLLAWLGAEPTSEENLEPVLQQAAQPARSA